MKALYIGSFDPFTIGHYEVLKQAEELFCGLEDNEDSIAFKKKAELGLQIESIRNCIFNHNEQNSRRF